MVTRWDAEVEATGPVFVCASDFRAKLLSRRRFVRCDDAIQDVLGLRDLETGIVYYTYTHTHTLVSSFFQK